jgi:hypothetical protein
MERPEYEANSVNSGRAPTPRELALRMMKNLNTVQALLHAEDKRIISSNCEQLFLMDPTEQALSTFPPENENGYSPTFCVTFEIINVGQSPEIE